MAHSFVARLWSDELRSNGAARRGLGAWLVVPRDGQATVHQRAPSSALGGRLARLRAADVARSAVLRPPPTVPRRVDDGRVIADVDRLLAAFLAPSLPTRTEISFERPDSTFASAVSGPTVSCFLHRVVEDTARRLADLVDVRGDDARVAGRQAPVRSYVLRYLVSAWAPSAAEQHALLDAVLVAALGVDVLHVDDAGDATLVRVGHPDPDGPPPHDLWSGLGVPLRASLALDVTAPLRPALDTDLAPPAEGITVGMEQIDARPRPTELAPFPAN